MIFNWFQSLMDYHPIWGLFLLLILIGGGGLALASIVGSFIAAGGK